MKFKKLLLILGLLPTLSYANNVNLDKLFNQQDNFCNQGQDGNLKGIVSYFSLNQNSDFYLNGIKVNRIEIKTPIVTQNFNKNQLIDEAQKYVKQTKDYNFKNIYTIIHTINLDLPISLNELKTKVSGINNNSFYQSFGNYDPNKLKSSTGMEDFEKNIKTIQVPMINASFMNMGGNTQILYQCKIITYTNDDLNMVTQKVSQ